MKSSHWTKIVVFCIAITAIGVLWYLTRGRGAVQTCAPAHPSVDSATSTTPAAPALAPEVPSAAQLAADDEGPIRLVVHRLGGDRVAIEAREEGGAPRAGRLWRWSFGDGREKETTEPRVEHDYAGRSQRTPATAVRVEVATTGPTGDTIRGATTLLLHNTGFRP